MSAYESRPAVGAAPESSTKTTDFSIRDATEVARVSSRTTHLDLDEIHVAWLCGYELGVTHGERKAAHHLAAELLHRQAAEMAGVAVRTASARHGADWGRAISEASKAVGA